MVSATTNTQEHEHTYMFTHTGMCLTGAPCVEQCGSVTWKVSVGHVRAQSVWHGAYVTSACKHIIHTRRQILARVELL